MITVHHLDNSRSHRILRLLEELELPYEIAAYQRDPATKFAPPELKRVHPLGRSPVIEEDGVTLAESGAIIEYLLARHDREDRLRPAPDSPDLPHYLYWLHFAEGSAMLPLGLKFYLSRLGEAAAPVLPRVEGQIADQLATIEARLSSRPFLAGESFTAADIQMSYPTHGSLPSPRRPGFGGAVNRPIFGVTRCRRSAIRLA